ncbi:SCO family protein [Singulisphaera acidiphila]|uniref:Uncharacterized protein SCO1/SenC/PrrC, involved in biogenesis of respiratory and photosynthetic systems n=1 Tax=Singulisphaera acidiphila (strain ATCC BAA-1392 / DSM 18658 / VKM B-2454 / MOB10) TaxID=886293 RepID=U3GKY5_SINAD|nr:SCO family protein [Singulisphaera acidiphila]AGA24480.1 uncharacterized protein SCO1/SenC/PrrC, involved in biogenesis of respiratory and photosynthetic systems [Singulisphaera acidiphila DSM 18658]
MVSHLLKLLGRLGDEPSPRPAKISDQYANVPLTNQFGERVRFRDDFADGRALIVNTMYTVCRGTCPGTSQTLQGLRARLTPLFRDQLTFVSITLDPVEDTPEMLRRYASIYGAGRRRKDLCDWQFLTGQAADIDRLRRSLGFYDLNPRVDQDLTQHASLLLFGNSKTDRWATLPAGLREGLLVEAIRRVCGTNFEQKYGVKA